MALRLTAPSSAEIRDYVEHNLKSFMINVHNFFYFKAFRGFDLRPDSVSFAPHLPRKLPLCVSKLNVFFYLLKRIRVATGKILLNLLVSSCFFSLSILANMFKCEK